MKAVLDRPGGSPPAEATTQEDVYECSCVGYVQSNLMLMCLRCLDAYSEALPLVLDGERLRFEMQRVAKRLAVLLKNDPLVANLPIEAVLNAADA